MKRNEKGQFLKGGKPTAEELAIKSKGLVESWKLRPDYIGDIKDIHPRIYNSWRSIRFTKKGKQAGCVEIWASFRSFYEDVEPSYQKGKVLRRKDILFPWGPKNFMWVTPSEAGAAQTSVSLEYNGKTLSIKQWAEELNLSFSVLKCRYYKHKEDYTIEEILFGRKVNRGSKTPKDVLSRPQTLRAKASKMISSYRTKDSKNGLEICDIDINWMVDNIFLQPCAYCGDTKRIGCDRIDNSKGHTKDNVIPCCLECNTARNNYFTYEEMRIIGAAIATVKKARGIDPMSPGDINIEEWKAHDTEYRRKCTMHKTYQFTLMGEYVSEFDSVNDASKSVGVTAKALSAACCGKNHGGHKCAGFLWSHQRNFKL